MTLTSLVLVWMVGLQDPAQTTWADTYQETAQAIADACEARPVFGSAIRCASVMTGIAYHESRFSPDRVGKAGEVSAWQIDPGWKPGKSIESRAKMAVKLISDSERICKARPLDERLSWYAAGQAGCSTRPEAVAKSRHRMQLAASLLK